MENKRESGYYWVKPFVGKWEIAYWEKDSKFWIRLILDDSYSDKDFDKINENRIKNPDEVGNE